MLPPPLEHTPLVFFADQKPLNPDPLITPIGASERNRGKLQTTVTPEMIVELLSASGFAK